MSMSFHNYYQTIYIIIKSGSTLAIINYYLYKSSQLFNAFHLCVDNIEFRPEYEARLIINTAHI